MTLTQAAATELAMQAVARCRALAAVTDVPGETTRTFLSEGMHRANARVEAWMHEAGLRTHTDAAGNLHGSLPGMAGTELRFLIGSHLDTVPNAGAFDGVLGVVLGVALARQFQPGVLPFDLEIVAFSEEEGVRFGAPFLGSKALVGELDATLLDRTDANGTSVRNAIERYGLQCAALADAHMQNVRGFLEFHIEQGPALESEDLPVGVVETVAGQSRAQLTFVGSANHAGTTPMHLRRDALAAAAAFVVEVERYARQIRGLVATVGSVAAKPNASNVIAGEVRVSLDVRSANDGLRSDAMDHLSAVAQQTADARGVRLQRQLLLQQAAVPLDHALLRMLEDAVDANGAMVRRMVSGAGHDAMVLAPHMPAAMLFLRSPDGISHHPSEAVRTEALALALRIGVTFLEDLARQTEDRP